MKTNTSILRNLVHYSAAVVGMSFAFLSFLAYAEIASAAPGSPPGCNATNLTQTTVVSPAGDVYDGDLLTYTVTYKNLDPDGPGGIKPCDITDANATIIFPDASPVSVLTDVDLPVGTTISCPGGAGCAKGPYQYVVDHNDEIDDVVTTDFVITGTRQGSSPSTVTRTESIPTTVLHPSTDVDLSVDMSVIVQGDEVVLTITESNDGDSDLIDAYVSLQPLGLTLDKDSPEFVGGDTGNDGILGSGEIWEWEVTDTPSENTTYVAIGHGTDSNGMDFTWCENEQDPPNGVKCDQDERDEVSVEVVKGLEIEKTAVTSFDREWDWRLDKSAEETELLLAEGETYEVPYTVLVDATYTDVGHQVSGIITIHNPDGNPSATIESVDDVLDQTGNVSVDCGVTFPYILAPDSTLECTYSSDSDGTDTLNSVTVETSGDVPGGSASADVNWSDPDEEIDECIIVNDTNSNGPQNEEVCADDAPKSFEYTVTFGPNGGDGVDVPVECGEIDWLNTADFVTNDTQTPGEDEWNIHVVVECFQGCTLTQGYWKTHSKEGPAPYDDNWMSILPSEESSPFYLSGTSWYQVFWTPPAKGNSYYQLAHQWIAAKLNVENGASVPAEVQTALDEGEALFNTYTPGELITYSVNKNDKTTGKKKSANTAILSQMTGLAGILASYNEGSIGPGHCDEQIPAGTPD